jgi:aspartate carbamoyltransferase catalytic subunit
MDEEAEMEELKAQEARRVRDEAKRQKKFYAVKEKRATFSRKPLISLLFFGSSTWARTRDLRINRKPGC